VVGRHITD
jgi:hypothetical protein